MAEGDRTMTEPTEPWPQEILQPTGRLRWQVSGGANDHSEPTLQQEWRNIETGKFEWREVPEVPTW